MNEDVFQLGIKGLITNAKDKVLLLQVNVEKLSNSEEVYWDIPGGRIHRGDSAETTLRREIEEEIGVTDIKNIEPFMMVVSNIRIPYQDSDSGLILSVYECKIDPNARITISDEHVGYKWFSKSEAAKLLEFKYPKDFIQALG